jgi:D-alanine-D-alanine ligase
MRRRVVVLFGGQSAEHDVSCTSVVSVLRALDPTRYEVRAIGVSMDGSWVDSPTANALVDSVRTGSPPPERVLATGEPLSMSAALSGASGPLAIGPSGTASAPDPGAGIVVIPVLHGPKGEDGTLQGLLELANVPYVGSGVLGSALAMDKAAAKRMLDAHGIPQALWMSRRSWELSTPAQINRATDEAAAQLGWPVFVKPANMGSSVGVSKAADPDALRDAIALAVDYDDTVVFEEAVVGREIEFSVLGNEAPEVSVAGEILPGNDFYDYDDKYLGDAARYVIPAVLDPAVLAAGQSIALSAFTALGCEGMARVDFFLDTQGRWLVNEVNTIPGFTPISMYPKMWAASGLPYDRLLDRLVELAEQRWERRSRFTGRGRR